ncbi:RPA-interacting protein [Ostrinia furnacalis]|uniref:RPA-interacting protein n=1 Tax=Ostrinia furnacalis TaxID=93504 RepID=UPI00103A9DFF|nr:RPA-interacting protein [Ostrinia furnacalis]XP_028160816.1 RPA-interacting protein [Ostrinia furnacalis]
MSNSPSASSPKFKNLRKKQRSSPMELKEKIRKNYKDKIQNCRETLMNRFRGTVEEFALHNTLTEIYNNMFDLSNVPQVDHEDVEVLEEIKNELIQEEMDWYLEEYEKSQVDVDWSTIEQENNVICPICQKKNLCLENCDLTCLHCKITIKTDKSLADVKKSILYSLEKHSALCNHEFQFVLVPESHESHIYLICSGCQEMQIVV